MTVMAERAPRVLYVTDGDIGRDIRMRREALGLSVRELALKATVDRATLTKLEAGDPTVRASTIGAVRTCLDRLEQEVGQDTPDLVTNTIELPDGTKVTFAGPADGVAEAASRFLSNRRSG